MVLVSDFEGEFGIFPLEPEQKENEFTETRVGEFLVGEFWLGNSPDEESELWSARAATLLACSLAVLN